jgi:hypothetical protein
MYAAGRLRSQRRGRSSRGQAYRHRGGATMLRLILLIVIILLVLGALPTWPYSAGWGYYPSGGLGLLLVILIVLVLAKRI